MIGGKGYGPGPAEMEESRKGTEKGAGGVFLPHSCVWQLHSCIPAAN